MLGAATIYVTDTHYASGHDGPRNAAKQVAFAGFGILAGIVVLRVGYQRIAPYSYILFGLGVLLLIPPVVARFANSSLGGLVPPRNGAYRWINLPGFQLQPSEVLKVVYVLALAWYLRYRKSYRRVSGLVPPFVISIVPLVLILLEPDLGTVLLLVPVLFGMLFMAGARFLHLGVVVLAGLALAPLAWSQIHTYQRLRISAMLLQSESLRRAVVESPEQYKHLATKRQAIEWAAGSGYQLVHSKNAIGSGGILGQGWGRGTYCENSILPDRHNDFVFAVVGHQWGLAGAMLVLACYLTIAVAGTIIASSTTEPFARLLVVGLVTLILVQALTNIAMTMGLAPVTGMTLPFVSYGGSSLLTSFVAIALIISVSQHRPYLLSTRPFEFQKPAPRKAPIEELAEIMPSMSSKR